MRLEKRHRRPLAAGNSLSTMRRQRSILMSVHPETRSAMDALPSRKSFDTEPQKLRQGADHIAPDCAGDNFYAIDRGLRDLLQAYLAPDDFRRLQPHFDRLGALAGGRLDELARAADKHPPVLNARDRFGRDEDWIDYHSSYREMEKIAFGDSSFTP
jgi:acyl-CoA dehydrogenase